ncbi:MAG: hypothetical protein KDD44_10885 [Bdellovibrionales bacterium]|nr:hypothetical protein [Bdellovibrionales bacterium]
MSGTPTLHSRLRVLVAKAFRASQLYASMRTRRGDAVDLAEVANSIRANVWQKTHYEFQSSLNEALLGANPGQLSMKVQQLRDSYRKAADDASRAVAFQSSRLQEHVQRQEFATILKVSLELIRLKAQAQATRALADELASALQANGATPATESEPTLLVDEVPNDDRHNSASRLPERPSNVIPFARRSVGGGGSR